ncbi:MAG: cation-transporting P-type ATPase, partial [Gaiellaceae bacterium]
MPAEAWRPQGYEVAVALETDPRRGLCQAEARARLERFGPNRLEEAERVPEWRKLLQQFADPLIYLLLAAVLVSLVAWA